MADGWPMAKLKVLLADRHEGFRRMLSRFLAQQKDLVVVGQARNGKEMVDQALALRPDLILVDLDLPLLCGLEATRIIKARLPAIKVILLTSGEGEEYSAAAARSGASAYVNKRHACERLLPTIRGLRTRKVVVVQRDQELAGLYASWLEGAGYQVLSCAGPQPPQFRCYVREEGRCSTVEQGDALLYDPWLYESPGRCDSEEVITALRKAYPQKPILMMLGRGAPVPAWVERLTERDPGVWVTPAVEREALMAAVQKLMSPQLCNSA